MSISVLLADDSQLIRDAIAGLLKNSLEIDLIGVADSFSETLRLLGELQPNLVLMDLHMKDEKSVEPTDLKSGLHGVPLLAMSVWVDPETKTLAETFGAVQLLDKATLAFELVPAIRKHAKNGDFSTAQN
jgi:DNA-binding NarL/FixJ family response regulator